MIRPDRFTHTAWETMQSAKELAERNKHPEVEPEHLLLAFLADSEGLTLRILKNLRVNTQPLVGALSSAIARHPKIEGGQLDASSRLKQVASGAEKLAKEM